MKRMVLIAVVGVFVAGLAAQAQGPAASGDIERLQGRWRMVSLEVGGAEQPVPEGFYVVYQGNTIAFQAGDRTLQKGTFKLNPGAKPKQIDTTQRRGEMQVVEPGIYKLEGDTLSVCASSGERPTEFGTEPGDGRTLVILKKAGVLGQ